MQVPPTSVFMGGYSRGTSPWGTVTRAGVQTNPQGALWGRMLFSRRVPALSARAHRFLHCSVLYQESCFPLFEHAINFQVLNSNSRLPGSRSCSWSLGVS